MTSLTRREMLRVSGAAAIGTFTSRDLFAQGTAAYWPRGSAWETLTPAAAEMNPAGLDAAITYAADHNSAGLVILRRGRIVAERYWKGWTAATTQPIFSSSKSITATLVGIAVEERKIMSVQQSASDFVPSWRGTPKAAITLRHMLTMTSGIRNTAGNVLKNDVDAFEETAALPLEHRPGEHWAYNTPVYRMLLRILEHATGETIEKYTQQTLAGPLGFEHSSWDCSPGPNRATNCTWYRSGLRDMSRFGLLVLRQGAWERKQVIGARFLKESTTSSQKLNQSYGYLWWLNGKASYQLPGARGGVQPGMLWPDCPPDAFGALGAQDKKIYVVPSLDLVVSRHGGAAGVARTPAAEGGGRASFDNELLRRICGAVTR